MRLFLPGAALLGAISFCGCSPNTVQSPGRAPAPVVTVVAAVRKNVPVDLRVVGNIEAYSTIRVRSQVGGQLTRVYFREGDTVRKGDALFLIDPRPLDEAIRQAQANLVRDEAQLKQTEANLQRDLAQERYAIEQAERYRKLFAEGVMSKQQADQYGTDSETRSEAVRADRAAIESAHASIQADRATLANARLQRSYCSIVSPVDGRTGNLAIDAGNIVKANDVDLVTINQVQPIYVAFAVPEGELATIKQRAAAGKVAVMASPPEAAGKAEQGFLTFVDNAVDSTTGTIRLKATFGNQGGTLWPGQFVNVVLRLRTIVNAVVVPERAVQEGQSGDYVYIVKPDQTVEMRPVAVGTRSDGQGVVIEKGVEAGESVVTEGQLKLAPTMKVRVRGAGRS